MAIFPLIVFGDAKRADQLAAMQTAGAFVLGTGGAALWLTARASRPPRLP